MIVERLQDYIIVNMTQNHVKNDSKHIWNAQNIKIT